MLDSILDWLRHHDGPLAYLVLGLASLIEYVFPPFPGDAIAIVGACLAFGAGYEVGLVYLVLVLGAVIGGQTMWALGRRLKTPAALPRFMRGPRADQAFEEVRARFASHGSLFLVVHRFIPALRAFVFVAAGMSGLSFWRVLVFGGLSAMLWNALLLGAAWLVSANWQRLAEVLSVYSWVVIALVTVGVGIAVYRRRKRAR